MLKWKFETFNTRKMVIGELFQSLHLKKKGKYGELKKFSQGNNKKKIAVKNLPEMQEMWRCGLDLWVRRIPWRRKWQPTPVILPRKSMDRGAWQATVNGVAKELNTIE